MNERFLRRTEVETITGLSRSVIYELMKTGKFPKAIALGPKSVAWPETEIAQWLEQKKAARSTA